MRVLLMALALGMSTYPIKAQSQDDATRDYMFCVRRNAEILEPSEDTPRDVAHAAAFLCIREEITASNLNLSEASKLRETALSYGAAQATIARVCRRTGRCGLAPVPSSK